MSEYDNIRNNSSLDFYVPSEPPTSPRQEIESQEWFATTPRSERAGPLPSPPLGPINEEEPTTVNPILLRLHRFMPITEWLPKYKSEYILNDVVSGLTVGTVVVPQSLAYAMLAGLEPVHGLYTSIIPPLVYSLFGTSEFNSVGV